MGQTKTKVMKTKTTETKTIEIFTLVKHNDKVRICLGNTCVHTGEFETFAEAEKVVKNRDWELLINATAFTMEKYFNLKHE